jgi:hypothetical protein
VDTVAPVFTDQSAGKPLPISLKFCTYEVPVRTKAAFAVNDKQLSAKPAVKRKGRVFIIVEILPSREIFVGLFLSRLTGAAQRRLGTSIVTIGPSCLVTSNFLYSSTQQTA